MEPIDRIDCFTEHILALDREDYEKKSSKAHRRERRNRLAFREMLDEKISKDQLTFKTKWRHFLKEFKDDERLFYMFKQGGSSPRDIFLDVREQVREKHKAMKNSFKNILKTHGDKISPEISLEKFKNFLEQFEDFKDLICTQDEKSNSLNFYAKYLLDKYKKRVDHAIQKYIKTCVKEIKSEDHKFEEFESKVNETESNKAYFACLKVDKKKELFDTVIDTMRKGEDLSKLLPKESKKKIKQN